jgi:hypothetical protein
MTITNKLGLPEGLVKAVSSERHNMPNCLSATTLLQGVKQILLTERYWDELSDNVSDRIWAIFGSVAHLLLEREGENDFTEQTMRWKVGGITVTGKIDNYDMQNSVICDYKTASIWKVKFGDFEDWYRQGMIYAWLLTKNGFKAEKCRFIALLKDHSKTEASRDKSYPRNPVYVYEFAVTPDALAEIERFIEEKVRLYLAYREAADDAIPVCSAKERWEKETKYAVMKAGRKSAVRVLERLEEAERLAVELGTGHTVETRRGESLRCKGYCLCCNFCDFYRENVAGAVVSPEAQAGEVAA